MAGIVKQQRIEIPTAEGVLLEGLAFAAPDRPGGAACVILHPYALLGGSMHDHMCLELFRAAALSKEFSLVVRYNQRGVGRSSGRMNVWGGDDMRDALEVVEWAAAQLPRPAGRVVLLGYSWGACVAAHALPHPSVAAYVGISPPLGGLSWVLQTRRHFAEVCRATHVPRLIVLGDQDQFTGEDAMREAVSLNGGAVLRQDDSFLPETDGQAAAAAAAGAPGGGGAAAPALPGAERRELLLRVFPGNDHFWMAYGGTAAQYAVGWVEALLQRARQQRRQEAQAAVAAVSPSDAGGDAGHLQ